MTDSIKPPGSGATPAAILPTEPPGALSNVAGPTPAEATTATGSASELAAGLAEQLKLGTLSAAQVIDAVVAQAVDSARAQGLPASEQDHLETILRAALVSDPTLAGLGRELER